MQQQNVFGKPSEHSVSPERQVRIHRHGSLIFLGQILVLGSVPFFDLGQDRTPTLFVIFSLSVSIATVWSLGYQRLVYLLAGLSLTACLWILFLQGEGEAGRRTVPLLIFLMVKLFCAYLCIRQAFKAGVAVLFLREFMVFCMGTDLVSIGYHLNLRGLEIFAGLILFGFHTRHLQQPGTVIWFRLDLFH